MITPFNLAQPLSPFLKLMTTILEKLLWDVLSKSSKGMELGIKSDIVSGTVLVIMGQQSKY